MEEQAIIERIDKFFDKENLDIQSKYFITKKMNEEYWEEITSEEDEDEDLLGDLGEGELGPEPEEAEEPSEEIAAPKPIKKKITVKKPKIAIKEEKKEEPPKEEEIEEKDVLM